MILLLSTALAFTSATPGEANHHDRVTRRAFRYWERLQGPRFTLAQRFERHDVYRLVEKPDGIELSLLLDRVTVAWLPTGALQGGDHPLTTSQYRAAHHFDRNLPDRGSVDAFLAGVAFLGEQYTRAVDPAVSPAAAMVALARAAHALEDFHAHSNFGELTTRVPGPIVPREKATWLAAESVLPGEAAISWYDGEALGPIDLALRVIDDCLAPWGRTPDCLQAGAATQVLDGVLVLTAYPGGDAPTDDLALARRGEPAWCGSADGYPCYTRGLEVRAEVRAPQRACTARYEADPRHLPREVEYVHDCFAKDAPTMGVRPLSEAARRKRHAFARARDYAALRVAVLFQEVRTKVGEDRWRAMFDAADTIADRR